MSAIQDAFKSELERAVIRFDEVKYDCEGNSRDLTEQIVASKVRVSEALKCTNDYFLRLEDSRRYINELFEQVQEAVTSLVPRVVRPGLQKIIQRLGVEHEMRLNRMARAVKAVEMGGTLPAASFGTQLGWGGSILNAGPGVQHIFESYEQAGLDVYREIIQGYQHQAAIAKGLEPRLAELNASNPTNCDDVFVSHNMHALAATTTVSLDFQLSAEVHPSMSVSRSSMGPLDKVTFEVPAPANDLINAQRGLGSLTLKDSIAKVFSVIDDFEFEGHQHIRRMRPYLDSINRSHEFCISKQDIISPKIESIAARVALDLEVLRSKTRTVRNVASKARPTEGMIKQLMRVSRAMDLITQKARAHPEDHCLADKLDAMNLEIASKETIQSPDTHILGHFRNSGRLPLTRHDELGGAVTVEKWKNPADSLWDVSDSSIAVVEEYVESGGRSLASEMEQADKTGPEIAIVRPSASSGQPSAVSVETSKFVPGNLKLHPLDTSVGGFCKPLPVTLASELKQAGLAESDTAPVAALADCVQSDNCKSGVFDDLVLQEPLGNRTQKAFFYTQGVIGHVQLQLVRLCERVNTSPDVLQRVGWGKPFNIRQLVWSAAVLVMGLVCIMVLNPVLQRSEEVYWGQSGPNLVDFMRNTQCIGQAWC
ncbi:hypothetical protein AAF712_008995 [Marasmius tenuissimus]|uniref:Uncharacterized protein n=1 Tax=Marasmius tenuissimus TaxID=585030 RepID=A0ABR2ZTF9_9AGAR